MRIDIVRALLKASERRHEVMDLVWSAAKDDDLPLALSHLLGVNEHEAQYVLDLRFRVMGPESRADLNEELTELEKLLS